jgi:hypothetical protein
MNLNAFAIGVIVSALTGIVIGLFIGHSLYYKPVAKETPAFAVKQPDKSLILARDPDAKAKPAHQIPKGATVERIVKVIVKAKTEAAPTIPRTSSQWSEPDHIADAGEMVDCPPVNLDLSLVRMPDETRRVIVSSQNGDVLDGIDIPVEAAKPVSDAKKWAIGAIYYSNRAYSARVERDLGPTRVSVEAMKVGSDIVAGVGFGIRF